MAADVAGAHHRAGGTLPGDHGLGRRVAAGEVELHTYVTDVMYVITGEATVVTGGEVLDRRQVGPGEYRGSALVGGTAQRNSSNNGAAFVRYWP